MEQIPGIKIFQYEASLYYANTEHFCDAVFMSTIDPTTCCTKRNSEVKINDFDLSSGDITSTDEEMADPPLKRHMSKEEGTQQNAVRPYFVICFRTKLFMYQTFYFYANDFHGELKMTLRLLIFYFQKWVFKNSFTIRCPDKHKLVKRNSSG